MDCRKLSMASSNLVSLGDLLRCTTPPRYDNLQFQSGCKSAAELQAHALCGCALYRLKTDKRLTAACFAEVILMMPCQCAVAALADPPQPFDFLVGGELVRQPLEQLVTSHGISAVSNRTASES